MASDLRPDRKRNRQAELSAHEHAKDSGRKPPQSRQKAEVDDLDKALSSVARGATSKRAFKAKLSARGQIRTSISLAAALIVRLDEAFDAFVAAADASAACTTKARTKLKRIADAKQAQLDELRKTVQTMTGLNNGILKAGKVVHDADLDRLLRNVQITGTDHMDKLLEGDAP